MRRKYSFLLLLALASSVQAQNIVESLRRNIPGQGKVTIHQDAKITALMSPNASVASAVNKGDVSEGGQKVIKGSGFRIQVYAGNNTRQAKNESHVVASRVKEYFPELSSYVMFNPPRWLCRVGDFRSIEEADATMRKMKATGVFKEVSIVKDKVNLSY